MLMDMTGVVSLNKRSEKPRQDVGVFSYLALTKETEYSKQDAA